MKCRIMWHFIWVFTDCKSTRLGFPVYKGLKQWLKPACSSTQSAPYLYFGCLESIIAQHATLQTFNLAR